MGERGSRPIMRNRPGFHHPDYLVLLISVATIVGFSAFMFSQLRHYGYEDSAIIVVIFAMWVGYLAFIALVAFASKPFLPTARFGSLFVSFAISATLILFVVL